ncbi:L-serine ammonia-lyase [Pendulispora rubella]|uniref:L-serine dehydratase n=1 Tax=Pendulispora rubella TaxID=2741070 RepID=A0ABZ2KYL0_9BACT
MPISVFDLFKIGIGPSSSHTVGPMRASLMFVTGLSDDGLLAGTASVRAELYGSLGATGKGHGSDKAVMLGLEGNHPARIDPFVAQDREAEIRSTLKLRLLGTHEISFDHREHVVMHRRESLPFHPNGMILHAYDADGAVLRSRTYYSVGGGFVVDENATGAERVKESDTVIPYPFRTGAQLLAHADETGLSISRIMLENEKALGKETGYSTVADIRRGLLEIWSVMRECVRNGFAREGVLPGGLKVKRRSAELYRKLTTRPDPSDPFVVMDWVNLYALAVNEENAAGGRVVTAPTNGAAGVIPAVMHYYANHVPGTDEEGIVRYLLTAGAIGVIYKECASISGAEVGCQGEVGSACSMAAAGLTEVLGGSPRQVENAAEIGMEHNLGLTCDPVGGLVQVPCIERNAIAAVKAINAARMALRGDGSHFVSLDKVIKTMRETGEDMKDKYKETSRGGLALNVIEC